MPCFPPIDVAQDQRRQIAAGQPEPIFGVPAGRDRRAPAVERDQVAAPVEHETPLQRQREPGRFRAAKKLGAGLKRLTKGKPAKKVTKQVDRAAKAEMKALVALGG